jgi:hypothetical protein
LLFWGLLAGRASAASGGLASALASGAGLPAMATVVAGANRKGVISALAVRGEGDVPASTNQRVGASALTAGPAAGGGPAAGLGGTSSSIATGTSGSAGCTLAAKTGCGASAWIAGAVVSAVAAGPNESAVNDSVTPIANNNANASHTTVCFIARFPEAIE